MKRNVRFAVFGMGKMGSRMLRYAVNHGGELVAAFTRSSHLGEDAGTVAELAPLGVPIEAFGSAPQRLAEMKPDICLVAARGTMAGQMEIFRVCAENGCNVLTIGENCQWPWTEAPELAKEADALAKRYGVTFSASGCPEVPWGALAATMAACCARVDRIRVEANLNLEFYGKGVLPLYPEHGINITMEEFQQKFAAVEPITQVDGHWPCLPGDQNGWLCACMGLTPVRQTAWHEPITYHAPVWSQNLEAEIPAGRLLGMNMIVSTETKEGITIEFAMAGKVFSPEDTENYVLQVYGEPDYRVVVEQPVSPIFTAATPVNRIPDIINAEPGFITAESLPAIHYLVKPMHEYIK